MLNGGQNSKNDYCGNLREKSPDGGRKVLMEEFKMTLKFTLKLKKTWKEVNWISKDQLAYQLTYNLISYIRYLVFYFDAIDVRGMNT